MPRWDLFFTTGDGAFLGRNPPSKCRPTNQYPNGVHFAVTRPQTQPGVTDRFAADLAEAVAYAQANRDTPSRTGAIYGGFPGGPTPESGSMLELLMGQLMDAQLSVPTP